MSDENSSLLTDGRDCSHDEGKDDCVHHCNFYEQYLNFRSRSGWIWNAVNLMKIWRFWVKNLH